jgi:pimeloyl-ACP methyl ester carboxylesterase
MTARLYAIEAGLPHLPPIVLLHGFGMVSESFSGLVETLSDQRFVLAFDLPGHGGSLDHPLAGSARKCADAVIAEIESRAIGPVTLTGHSFGGAVASLAAMSRPDLVSRLILLAPGGFGPEIAADLLRGFATAISSEDIATCLQGMAAPGFKVPESLVQTLAAMRQIPNQTRSLIELSARFLRDGKQGVLPLESLAAAGIPVDLVWGDLDAVVPVTDAMLAPASFRKTVIAGAGHMLADEALENITRIILG